MEELKKIARSFAQDIRCVINNIDARTERLDMFINVPRLEITLCLYDPFGDYEEEVTELFKKYNTKVEQLKYSPIAWVRSDNELLYRTDPDYIKI